MERYRAQSIAVLILNLDTKLECSASCPGRFTSRQKPRYPLKILCGLQNLCGPFGEKKNLLPPPVFPFAILGLYYDFQLYKLLIQKNNRQSFRRQAPALNTNPTLIKFGIAHVSIMLNSFFLLNKVYSFLLPFPDLRGTKAIKLGHTKTSPF
jgi:hypothetical protein